MPSASPDRARGGYLLRYRPPGAARQVQVRARPEWRVADLDAARALASKLDRASRILDGTDDGLGDPAAAARLLSRHGLDAGQVGGRGPESPALGQQTALLALFHAHPATRRDDARPRYEAHLVEFMEWSGITDARHVAAAHVERWVEELRARGQAYDTRRHRLLPIRRAMHQASRHGIVDPLVGARLDRQEARARVATLSLPELRALLAACADDPRALALAMMMGALALRPTEALRARVGDVVGNALVVGDRVAKNSHSRRVLPLPSPVLAVLAAQCDGRPEDAPLCPSRSHSTRGAHMDIRAAGRLLERRYAAAGLAHLPAKALRKSWFSISVGDLGLDPMHCEQWMGHAASGVSVVSARHYLATPPRWLLPIAEAWAGALPLPNPLPTHAHR